ncbi:MAG: rRNA maturation RNase YbeY [Candidatus Edwardsbacteria bacterium]
MKIYLEKTIAVKIPEGKIKKTIQQILTCEDEKDCNLTVVFSDDKYLRSLNRRFRNVDKPTDVIAFSMLEGEEVGTGSKPAPTHQILGDIYISVQRAKKQSKEYQVSFEEELLRLAVHGVLHLLGYDHQTPEQAKKMRRKEGKFLIS